MKSLVVLIVVSSMLSINVYAQKKDSIRTKNIITAGAISTVLIGSGVIINNSQFEKDMQINICNRVGDDFEFHIDDYVQYFPIVEMYIADAVGIKSRNHWFDQTKYLLISNIITAGITHGLKSWVDKTRPNGGAHSFPSGHTTFAFTNATVLCNEFSQTSAWFAYSGYAFAVTTGAFRMINNKHWLSDVLVGVGIGILVPTIIYYFEPLKSFNPFKKSKNISFIPQVSDNKYGLYFSYKF